MASTKSLSRPSAATLQPVAAPTPKRSAKKVQLRSSITPGTVLILLAGRFRGKRVVFLEQLPSGLLLVCGPHKVNGVPLKRVNQRYVIATSTKVDISSVAIPKISEDMFKKTQKSKSNKDGMFDDAQEGSKKVLTAERKQLQSNVDALLLAEINKVPNLRSYLKSLFSLKKGQAPHSMKF